MLKIIGVILILAVLVFIFFFSQKQTPTKINSGSLLPSTNNAVETGSPRLAVEAGKKLSSNQCQGEGVPYKLSALPMKMEDFSHIEPYGLMIGGHVTPIDHQYFAPANRSLGKDSYEVYTMADAKLVGLETHPTRIRLVFSVTCTFFYYYDLLTSLQPEFNDKNLPISVKAGQLIGHIGGQTLDFAVWDTTKPLKGFIVPEHYKAEAWKIYTVDPLDYYTDQLKAQILSKYVRTVEPLSGKIDYDVDSKIIGNWFEQGTNGFAGLATNPASEYWKGHLSIVPFAYDPSAFIISVGYLTPENGGSDNQFSVPRNAPNPATIGVDSGLTKYELRRWNDLKPDGTRWNHMEFVRDPKLDNEHEPSSGCALVQLMEARKLKFETFLKQTCENISGFSSNARIYER